MVDSPSALSELTIAICLSSLDFSDQSVGHVNDEAFKPHTLTYQASQLTIYHLRDAGTYSRVEESVGDSKFLGPSRGLDKKGIPMGCQETVFQALRVMANTFPHVYMQSSTLLAALHSHYDEHYSLLWSLTRLSMYPHCCSTAEHIDLRMPTLAVSPRLELATASAREGLSKTE